MIPRRRARVAEEIELSDEDLIEVTPQSGTRSVSKRSGTYALSRPRETRRPLPSPPADAASDGADTSVSDLIGNLARLSDPNSIPRLRGAVEWSELSPCEAWLVCIITEGMPLAGIMQTSPLGEEETLRLFARLVSGRIITLLP